MPAKPPLTPPNEPSDPPPDAPPDPLAGAIRFVGGFLSGLLAGWLAALTWDAGSWTLLVMLIVAVVCGGLALRHGGRFRERWLK